MTMTEEREIEIVTEIETEIEKEIETEIVTEIVKRIVIGIETGTEIGKEEEIHLTLTGLESLPKLMISKCCGLNYLIILSRLVKL